MSHAQTNAVSVHDGRTRLLAIDVTLNAAAPSAMNALHAWHSYSALECARDRVRAALCNSATRWPDGRLTISASHPDIDDSTSDLAIAVAVLAVSAAVTVPVNTVFIGQLTLDGRLRPAPQTADAVLAAHAAGFTRAVIPTGALDDTTANLPRSIIVLEADNLITVAAWLTRHTNRITPHRVDRRSVRTLPSSLTRPATTKSEGIAVRKADRVHRYTTMELAVRLMSVITDGMEHGRIDWNCRRFHDIVATSGDPTDAMDAVIEAHESDSGQQRDQFMPEIYAIVDRMLASRLTFGPDNNPTYHIGTVSDGYIAATAPPAHRDHLLTVQDEIELSITDPAQRGTAILSSSQVDALIAGLVKWRDAHPDRTHNG